MAQVPTLEKIILEVHRCLGMEVATRRRNKLVGVKGGLTEHWDELRLLLDEILENLEVDELEREDLTRDLIHFAAFNEEVRQKIYTYEADKRQVLWYVAAYLYMPALGRKVAFWQLDERMDSGMPGGHFWYLPKIQQKNNKSVLVMPVAQVVQWLLDLCEPMATIKHKLGGGLAEGENFGRESRVESESMERLLYEWLDGTTPKLNTINKYFPDTTPLDFKGAISVDETEFLEDKFTQVREFVERKDLLAEELAGQIPMTDINTLEHILGAPTEKIDESLKEHFVALILNRYSAPSMQTIRRMLSIARATQAGYYKLVEALLEKEFDNRCADQGENKVLQLLAIFQLSYNLTVESDKGARSVREEEQAFDNLIPDFYKSDVFSSIAPSCRDNSLSYSPELLTRIFSRIRAGDELRSLIPHDEASLLALIQEKEAFFGSWHQEEQAAKKLGDSLRRKSPWRCLQDICDFWVVGRMVNVSSLPYKTRYMAANRMHELAANPVQVVNAICVQLALVLHNDGRNQQTKESKGYVEALLAEAKSSEGYAVWKAPLLSYEAKHLLSTNDFDSARKKFKEALEACVDNSFASVHGEIARDAFSLEVGYQGNGYNLKNCHYYYRNMILGGVFDFESEYIPPVEDIAADVGEYFWSDLYKPYPGFKKVTQVSNMSGDDIADGFKFASQNDWDMFSAWLKTNKSTLGGKSLRDARGGTVLSLWQKMIYSVEEMYKNDPRLHEVVEAKEIAQDIITPLRQGFYKIIVAWPKLTSKTDYKNQTPLMLAANVGDTVTLTKLLSVEADVYPQDFKGRTVLHAAIAGGVIDCIKMLINHDPEGKLFEIKDIENSSVLHTAVRLGNPEAVSLIIKKAPHLMFQVDENGLRPVDLSQLIVSDTGCYETLISFLKKEKREYGAIGDYQLIRERLARAMS